MKSSASIERIEAAVYEIPTEAPESDGTYTWSSTQLLCTHVEAAGVRGFGYSYAGLPAAAVVHGQLTPRIVNTDAMAVEAAWDAMQRAVRNTGRPGVASHAISAVDAALWDLKAKLLELPLVTLLGSVREAAPIYGSGGFTSYTQQALCQQLVGWSEAGMSAVKMKVGRNANEDVTRVAAAREALGDATQLMVDANGAYDRNEAVAKAEAFGRYGVEWLEEPVTSDDLCGLRFVRDRAPAGMSITAGEYGYDATYFRHMLEAGAVSVLQADATRCLGITGFLAVGRLCQAFHVPLSAHTAPSLHLHPACAMTPLSSIEYFHDHVRIESLLFEGFRPARKGMISPDRSRPGIGVELKSSDASRFAIT